jgi:hypothetical protein
MDALAYLFTLVSSGLVMLPFGVPVLSLETLLRYQKLISLENVVQTERDSAGDLHRLYADMLGWESMVATIATFTTTPHIPIRHTARSWPATMARLEPSICLAHNTAFQGQLVATTTTISGEHAATPARL